MTGTVRKNVASLPPAAKRLKMEQGEIRYYRKGHVTLCAWKDRSTKPVLALSTAVGSGMKEVVTRRGNVVRKPKIIDQYNKGMGGVDLGDLKAYTYAREGRQVSYLSQLVVTVISFLFIDYKNLQPSMVKIFLCKSLRPYFQGCVVLHLIHASFLASNDFIAVLFILCP